MANAEERNADATTSISSDSTSETTKNKKVEQTPNSSNSRGHRGERTGWETSDCLCNAYNITPCIPEMMLHNPPTGRARNFTWKWPREPSKSKKPYPNFEPIMGTRQKIATEKNTSAFPDGHSDFQEIHQKFKNITGKIEIYYFDHGNSAYYRTTDAIPLLTTERFADKTDQAATRFWAELFGTIHIGITFIIAFILQLLRFTLYSLIRPLTIGIIQLLSDYLIKPLLTIIFNALIQPVLILLYNIATSLRDLCEPIAETIGFFVRELARLLQAIRLVEVNRNIINNGNVPT